MMRFRYDGGISRIYLSVLFLSISPNVCGIVFCSSNSQCGPNQYCYDGTDVVDFCRSCDSPLYPCNERTALGRTCVGSDCPQIPEIVSPAVYQGSALCFGSITGTINESHSRHTFGFRAPRAGRFVFDSCGSNFDTFLRIYLRSNLDSEPYVPFYSCDDCGECEERLPGQVLSLQTVADLTLDVDDYVLAIEGAAGALGHYEVNVYGEGCISPPTTEPSATPSYIPSKHPSDNPSAVPSIAPTVCIDVSDWILTQESVSQLLPGENSGVGLGCSFLETNNLCDVSPQDLVGVDGLRAEEACVACGGGLCSHPTTALVTTRGTKTETTDVSSTTVACDINFNDEPFCCGFDRLIDCLESAVAASCPRFCGLCEGVDPASLCTTTSATISTSTSTKATISTSTSTTSTSSTSALCITSVTLESRPLYLAFDNQGNIWVTHEGGLVRQYNNNGVLLWTSNQQFNVRILSATGIAFDPLSSSVYFADQLAHRIIAINTITRRIGIVAGTGGPGDMDGDSSTARFNLPSGVSVATNGSIFVADLGNNKIRRVDVGEDAMVTTIAEDQRYPATIAIQRESGTIYFSRSFQRSVQQLSAGGVMSALIGTGTGLSTDGLPLTGLAVSSHNTLYVADVDAGAILMLSLEDAEPSIENVMRGQSDQLPLEQPLGLAIDSLGTLHVVDTETARLWSVNLPCLNGEDSIGIETIDTSSAAPFASSTVAPSISTTPAPSGSNTEIPSSMPTDSPSLSPTQTVRSSDTCEALRADCGDRWVGQPGDVCMEERLRNDASAEEVCNRLCLGTVSSWNRAKIVCSNVGARLCTVDELIRFPSSDRLGNCTTPLDDIWSVTLCEGGVLSVNITSQTSSCGSQIGNHKVRCCGDSAPTFSPTKFPTVSPVPPTTSHPTRAPSFIPSAAPSCPAENDPESILLGIDLCAGPYNSTACCAGGTYSRICRAKCCGTYCGPTSAPTISPSLIPTPSPSVSPTANPTSCARSSEIFCSIPELDFPRDCCGSALLITSCQACCGHECPYAPTTLPSSSPTKAPSMPPTEQPSWTPTTGPSKAPSRPPTEQPSWTPTKTPSAMPTIAPTVSPTAHPVSSSPSIQPTEMPTTSAPSVSPTSSPSLSPTISPSSSPSLSPTISPSSSPSLSPTVICEGEENSLENTVCTDVTLLECKLHIDLGIGCNLTCCEMLRDIPIASSVRVLDDEGNYIPDGGGVAKGRFRGGNLRVQVAYRSPPSSYNRVRLFPIITNLNTNSTRGTINGVATLAMNDLLALPHEGIFNLSIRLLSGTPDGPYKIHFEIGLDVWANRFPGDYQGRRILLANEFVRFRADFDLSINQYIPQTSRLSPMSIGIEYWASSPVKFAVHIFCRVPVSQRVDNLQRCDGVPRFTNNRRTSGLFAPATAAAGESSPANGSAVPHQITVAFASYLPRDQLLYLRIKMGRYDPGDGTWIEPRDSTVDATMIVSTPTTTLSPTTMPIESTLSPTTIEPSHTPSYVPSELPTTLEPTLSPVSASPSASPTEVVFESFVNGESLDGEIICGGFKFGSTAGRSDNGGNGSPDVTFTFTIDNTIATARFDACPSLFDTQLRVLRVVNGVAREFASSNDTQCGDRSFLSLSFDSTVGDNDYLSGNSISMPIGNYAVSLEGGTDTASGSFWLSMLCTVTDTTTSSAADITERPTIQPTQSPSTVSCFENVALTSTPCLRHTDCNTTNVEYCIKGGRCQYCWECQHLNDSITGNCPDCYERPCFPRARRSNFAAQDQPLLTEDSDHDQHLETYWVFAFALVAAIVLIVGIGSVLWGRASAYTVGDNL